MQVKCWWEAAPTPGRCVAPGCPKEARLSCHEHPEEGNFCSKHRSIHTRSVAKRNAELDSRPREPARARRQVQNLEGLTRAMNKEQTPEATGVV